MSEKPQFAWIDLGNGRQVYRRIDSGPAPAKSDLPRPMIRSDGMSATWNPVDGRHYESKSAYERAVKAAGCEIVGNDAGHWNKAAPSYEPKGVKEDLREAWKKLSS